jgi:hypothetical protein
LKNSESQEVSFPGWKFITKWHNKEFLEETNSKHLRVCLFWAYSTIFLEVCT